LCNSISKEKITFERFFCIAGIEVIAYYLFTHLHVLLITIMLKLKVECINGVLDVEIVWFLYNKINKRQSSNVSGNTCPMAKAC
jgi:hypothetical protein